MSRRRLNWHFSGDSLCIFTLQKVNISKNHLNSECKMFKNNLFISRRNDRRVRYLADMFNAFFPGRGPSVTLNTTDNSDEATLNNTIQSKLDFSMINGDDKTKKFHEDNNCFSQTPILQKLNINEKRQTLEKEICIENLKTSSSPYLPIRRSDSSKFNAKEQLNVNKKLNANIYSDDPLVSRRNSNKPETNSVIYESVDLHLPETQEKQIEPEEVVYDVINTTTDRILPDETDYDSVMYATPKNTK